MDKWEDRVPDGLRPGARAVAVNIRSTGYGTLAEFRGTEQELIAAGVAEPDWFDDLGKTGCRTGPTPYGDQFHVQRRKGGLFELMLLLRHEPYYGNPGDARTRKRKRWRDHGAEVEKVVADLIARMRKPRNTQPQS